ncbi:PIN domain-containing protein [Candidatus Marithioploca araucensis]|uniref:PIN domain-containing protein n=1 Tax=Candidatus Marithioploca araucensis TaxID=70273 RepID=A0ABT7VSD1_9GAMM|nr:PIN domain-containing protein [Candidatus Marithioploca araucensis]
MADAGFWLALANKKDKHHARSKQCLRFFNETLITTWPVMTETCHLLLNRMGQHAQQSFIENYAVGTFEVFQLTDEHALRVVELMNKYADLPMDLADASLVILAEHIGHGRIFSTDKRDFHTYRWKHNKPFENLLFRV